MKKEKFIYKGGSLKLNVTQNGEIKSEPQKLAVKKFENGSGQTITRLCHENAIGILIKDYS